MRAGPNKSSRLAGRSSRRALLLSVMTAASLHAQELVPGQEYSMQDIVQVALRNNRDLQIERISQQIARFTLKAAYGIYDPRLDARVHTEEATDPGGFDPANFSADAVFTAESEVASGGLTGYLPTGLTYLFGANYAHSDGQRNFLNFDSYKMGTGVYLEQPLLRNFWIDQPRYEIQVRRKDLKITELGVQFETMNVINLTQQGYHDLQYAWENLKIQQDLYTIRSEFVAKINRQVELGYLTSVEQRIAQSQTAVLETEQIGSSNLVALASNNLRTLIGISATNWSSEFIVPSEYLLTIPEQFDLPRSWQTGIDLRPDLAQLAVNLERSEVDMRFRKNQLFPSLNLFGSYSVKGADALQAFPPDRPLADRSLAFDQLANREAPNHSIGVLFSVPLTRTAERNAYKASKESRKQAELLLKQKEELIMREISDAINFARFSLDRATSARSAVRLAEDALKAEEQRFLGGTGGINFVVDAQTGVARARLAEAAARRDYNKALAQLYFTEGSLLERRQIEIKYR